MDMHYTAAILSRYAPLAMGPGGDPDEFMYLCVRHGRRPGSQEQCSCDTMPVLRDISTGRPTAGDVAELIGNQGCPAVIPPAVY